MSTTRLLPLFRIHSFFTVFIALLFNIYLNAENTFEQLGADVEITLTVDDSSLVQYEFRTFTLTVRNTGDQTAFGLSIPFEKPEHTSYVSSNANGGSFNAFAEIWTIPVLSPGNEFQLTFTVFILEQELPITVFREVIAMDNADMDSTPGNGTCCAPNEDDEAVVTLGGVPIDTIGVDLSLDLKVDTTLLELFFSRNFTLTVQNTGDSTARDVVIDFPIPEGLAYVEHQASQGILDNFNGIWDVGNIAPGGVAYLHYELYIISEDTAIITFVQVAASSTADVDSEPGNGTCCTPQEDDEAVITISKPFIGGDGVDLELSVDVDNPQLGQYEVRQLTYTLVNNGITTAQEVVVQIPLPQGTVFAGYTATQGSYGLGSTMWTVGTLEEGDTAIINYNIFLFNDTVPVAAYAQVLTAVPFDIDSYPGNGLCCEAIEDDEADFLLGGNSGDEFTLDLELEMNVDNPQLTIFQERTFTLTLTNNSSVVGQNIKIDFPLPELMAYVSHNTSQGIFDSWNGIWDIGNIAAGGTATLVYTLYTLTNSEPVNVFAQIASANPNDMDSTPGNGGCCVVNEDDEALVTLAPQLMNRSGISENATYDISDVLLYPIPATESLFLEFSTAQEATYQVHIYNLKGQLVFSQPYASQKGRNKLNIPVAHFPKSVYILTLSDATSKHTFKWKN